MTSGATFHLLHTGYVRGDAVASSVSLILDGDARLIVDPWMVADRDLILVALQRRGVLPSQITHVLLTHHHPDHTLNAALFPNAEVIDVWARYRGDRWLDHDGEGYRPTPHVRLLPTPGHTAQDITWLVETADGVVAFTHAWWHADRTPVIDPLAEDQAQLEVSRERILREADVVVPGHGAPFPTGR
jgi:glyoxylase-like metal-dependent hydrolase (beta-lactamase superfamily II)